MITTKLFIVLSCLLVAIADQAATSTADNSTENCASWPSDLKSLAECCDIPYHSEINMERLCEEGCTAHKDFNGDHMKCVLDCYLKEGTELMKKGKFNPAYAALLYDRADYTRGLWKKVIADGVTTCHYESNGALKENLAKYFNCVDEYLTEKCVELKSTDECFKVFNHIEDCKSSKLDCSKWPANLTFSANCCQMPQVLKDISSTCTSRCAKKELLPRSQYSCGRLCDGLETGLLTSEGSINFDRARENLQKSEAYSEKWKQPIENAIESCKTEVKGFTNSEAVSALENCIRYNLGTHCVEFRPFSSCYEQSRFMTLCPNTTPPK